MKQIDVDLLLSLADDELILGWRNSEWTGIAPFLEEDVAFSSIAQNEIGHARALYDLAARELGTDADALAFDRSLEEYRSAPLVELRRLEWARTIARHWLYETADAIRIEALKASDDSEIAGIAAKIDREEVYHRIHAEMWTDRLLASDEARPRLDEALEELWPYALGVLDEELRPELVSRVEAKLGREMPRVEPVSRGEHEAELAELLEEMTMVRRSAPAGARW
ncbi:1,2-phenylacetyl-CoA epoxidase subunit PaaC [Gaiella sp.]|jgi:ring-1,2-phenylacetyl-CoA epoxidase subunit PaaC|uniref:1,2-phenylacetyl-CoA epoxidase subunit PaaC n=1 Tax=Gaiella sp. TaxID=2663207 RepID=UPI002E34B50D|nr:1,2-phenylacetyl-CoA epoxidase subunit PaaC [Gaiella sp.]HEX5584297.1 1,2-phenylacetyl-CoA epoxidase subunit PaaC [Gaiella sp.]